MAQYSARQTARPITGRRTWLVPGWMLAGACGLLLWAESAVGVDVGLNYFSSNRQALVTLNGGTGQWHRIEASTNLLNWRALTNLCLTNPATGWLDTGASNYQQRFYQSQELTPLDLYVATPDTNYGYTVLKTNVGAGQTTYILELQSQAWLTTNEVDRPLWKHWLVIVERRG